VIHDRHPLKPVQAEIPTDISLTEERGWVNMDVRWLISAATVSAQKTVVGRTVFPPGAKHDLHRHPNAEEWEYVIRGSGVKQVGEDAIRVSEGELVFVPQDVYHGLENTSETDVLVTIWGYCGASTLEEAGYLLPDD
jgi:quercetin dioxygenase-like cupin family protein